MTYTRSKIFSTLMMRVTSTTTSTGRTNGTVTLRKTCHSVAPSTRAASKASRGSADSPAEMSTIAKPAHIHRYDTMIEGVTRSGPSQSTPWKGSAKLDFGSRMVYPLPVRCGKWKAPVLSVVVLSTTRPARTASTRSRGSPRSDSSTTPDVPPPPLLKSSHTTPARPPPPVGTAAWRASVGSLSGARPTSGSRTTEPAAAGLTVW
jgi:hypothetical protein